MLGITAISQDAIAALGTPTTFAVVNGLQLNTSIGNLSFQITGSTLLSSQNISANTGNLQVDPDVIATGQPMQVNIGPYSIKGDALGVILQGENEMNVSTGALSFTITGSTILPSQNTTVAIGQFEVISAVNPLGDEATIVVGDVSQVTGTAVVQLSGQPITASLGEEDAVIDVSVSVGGLSTINTSINSVTTKLNTPVDLAGQNLTIATRTPSTVAWSDVNQNVTNLLVEVDIAA